MNLTDMFDELIDMIASDVKIRCALRPVCKKFSQLMEGTAIEIEKYRMYVCIGIARYNAIHLWERICDVVVFENNTCRVGSLMICRSIPFLEIIDNIPGSSLVITLIADPRGILGRELFRLLSRDDGSEKILV